MMSSVTTPDKRRVTHPVGSRNPSTVV
jgi:hypothetical protein